MRLNFARQLAVAVEIHDLNVTMHGFHDAVGVCFGTGPFRFAADFAQRRPNPIEFASGELLATAAIAPWGLDVAFMTLLFKAKGARARPEQPSERATTMTGRTDLAPSFRAKLREDDAAGARGLMAPDIEWLTMWR